MKGVMKNKGLIIGLAVGLLLLLVGIFIFIYIKDPEILTKSPSEIISGGVTTPINQGGPTEAEETASKPGSCLVTTEENCSKARIPYKAADNSRLPGIGFINVPVGTEVFAPFDGKIFLRVDYYNDSPSQTIVFTDDMDWQPGMTYRDEWHYLSFRAKEFSIDNISNRFKKGEVIAVVNSMDIIIKGLTKENYNFIVTISSWWSNLSDSLDPVQYMQELLKDLEK